MDWTQLLKDFGLPVATLVVFATAVIKGWLVAKPSVKESLDQKDAQIEDLIKQRDRLLDLALRYAEIGRAGLSLGEKVAGHHADG